MHENDKPVLIYSTFPSAAEAERIGGALVDRGLAACVNIFDGMTSFYMASPSGLQIEYGYGGRRVDNPWVARSQGGVGGASLWGHRPAEQADHGVVAAGFRA